jgi:hypothetical protein
MDLFVPLYGSFRACLKRVMLMAAQGPRPRPKSGPTLKYFGSCRAWAVLFSVLRDGPLDPAQMYTYSGSAFFSSSPSAIALMPAEAHDSGLPRQRLYGRLYGGAKETR